MTYEDILVDVSTDSPPPSISKSMAHWSVEEVCIWLHELGMGQYESTFRRNDIDGMEVTTLTHESMQTALGIGEYLRVWFFL